MPASAPGSSSWSSSANNTAIQARLQAVYSGWHATIARYLATLQHARLVTTTRHPDRLAIEVFAYVEGLAAYAHLYQLDPHTTQTALLEGLTGLLDPEHLR